ncbi:hypothetical protein L596_023210 [Steinernema carpocapsae]|uniref:CHK kinase-like domain-containing protein n=1 Tax=Steinernema carpocapsae TaxID=34508 RepID=A0A4U5MDS2_STECR|nr:hypothetical protein L596_023210 [Steinernema carpocapsae]
MSVEVAVGPVKGVNVTKAGEKLDDSVFEVSWLIDTLTKNDPKFKETVGNNQIQKVWAKNISGGKGFVSKVYECVIEFDSPEPDYEVILKVPGMDAINKALGEGEENVFESGELFANLHNNERAFYDQYAKHVSFPTPKIYATGEWVINKVQGFILMESMIGRGANACMYGGLSKTQLFVVAKQIAHFQHSFLTTEDRTWMKRFDLEEKFEDQGIVEFTIPMFDKLIEMKPDIFKKKIKPFYEASKNCKFQLYCMIKAAKELGIPSVLAHGDLWSNNIMWKLDMDGNITNEIAAIIDYQIIHTGSITTDLARILVCCTDADVRRMITYDVLAFYYKCLKEFFHENGKEVPFSFEQVKASYRISQLGQTADLLWMVPLFLNDQDLSTEQEKIQEARKEKLYLRASLALDEALQILQTIPKEKISD